MSDKLYTTLPDGSVREATIEEQDAFIEQFPNDPASKAILAARKAAENPPVRKPAAGKDAKVPQGRGRGKSPKAQESDET